MNYYHNENIDTLGLLKTIGLNTHTHLIFYYEPIPRFRCEPEHDVRHGPIRGIGGEYSIVVLRFKGPSPAFGRD